MATVLIGAVIITLLVFALRYLIKNGSCAGCPAKTQCQKNGSHPGCTECAHHTSCGFVSDES